MTQRALFAGGCFWCTEAMFTRLRGVLAVQPAYAGGHTDHPTYEAVCTGTTGHAEVVDITFDPEVISYRTLLEVFFAAHDPTTLNRQGNDIGTQYRSAIFTLSSEQAKLAEEVKQEAQNDWSDNIVTEIEPAGTVYPAEDYHREYFLHHPDQPYCAAVIRPKVQAFSERFREYLREA